MLANERTSKFTDSRIISLLHRFLQFSFILSPNNLLISFLSKAGSRLAKSLLNTTAVPTHNANV